MPREKDGYRETIEQLNRYVPDRELLAIQEVMQITGWRSVNTVKKHLGCTMVAGKVPKVALAKFLCR